MLNHPELQGQIALVTGASRGIGRAVAKALGARGATVIGTSTTQPGADSISEYLKEDGQAGRGALLNVNDGMAIDSLVSQIEKDFGAVSILVNNAGITRDTLMLRMKDEDWDDVLDTNLKAVFRMCRAVMRGMMKARGGRIINIGSVVGTLGNAGQANYAAAKAGLIGFTKSMAREIASRNITVNCVAPGFIDTDMTRALSDDQKKALTSQIPLGRLGDASDVAAAVLFLASPGAGYITGATLHVNGGMDMN